MDLFKCERYGIQNQTLLKLTMVPFQVKSHVFSQAGTKPQLFCGFPCGISSRRKMNAIGKNPETRFGLVCMP